MCGIAGFVGDGTRSDLEAMTRALVHRGPDGEGFYQHTETRTFLGHRRLAVLDIAGGHQPLWNEDDTVGVVFNGEIYNHQELRAELIALGHRFRSDHSDTEVLVHGYEQWGEDLPARLNGMFAFAIFDERRKRLFLSRDRFGEKPLYYYWRRGLFAFASELDALPRHTAIDAEPDIRAIQKFFAYGFFPAPHSYLIGCRKLAGGCHLTIDCSADREPEPVQYWRFQVEPDHALLERDENELAEELRALLLQATERRLISDVPLGVFLSGGLDSSVITASMARLRPPASVRSFTIGFTEPSFDEAPYALEVAQALGTQHHTDVLDYAEAQKLIPQVLSRLDEPLGDPSIIPTFMLCRATRQHVTVALSGDGGDELFAGYDPFAALKPAGLYSRCVPHFAHRGIRRLADLLPVSDRNMSLDFKIKRALKGLSYPSAIWNPVWMGPLEPDAMADIFDAPLQAEDLFSESIAKWNRDPRLDAVDRTLEYFTNFYLPDSILTKVDRAAMMSSLESRAVFLDNDVVRFCQRLPHQLKFKNGTRKYLLKKAASGLISEAIINRKKKGFGVPLTKYLRTIPTPAVSAPAGMRGDHVARCWAEHQRGSHDHRLLLWSWLGLQAALNKPADLPLAACAPVMPINAKDHSMTSTSTMTAPITELAKGSPDRFGYEWGEYAEMRPEYEEQFRRWTPDMQPEDWRGVSFVDGGCGMGRNSYWPMTYGAACSLSVDVDARSLASARRTLKDYPAARVVEQSIYDIPATGEHDVAFSIGVIHHLEKPEVAMKALVGAVKPGGKVLIWVYGLENNRWIVHLVSPIRKLLLGRLPIGLVHHLSLYPSILLWLWLRIRPGGIAYMRLLRTFTFRHLRSIVFDQMLPKIAHYWSKAEVEALMKGVGLSDVKLTWVNEMSWAASGTRPKAATAS